MENIEFSIIIPVYNRAVYLNDCIESVIRQTYKNIEIICVDDASSDCSLEILEDYRERDERMHVIAKEHNEGTSKARKDGVLFSKGRHILFLDADDQLATNACERLLEIYAGKKSDIIHFAVSVKGSKEVKDEKVKAMWGYLQPCIKDISIEEARKLCFYNGELAHNLCGKMFDGDICRKAFSYISDDRMIMAEDLYAYFVISIFSKSYVGISDELYQYNYGPGITGEIGDFFETMRGYCLQSQIIPKCYEFVKAIGELEKYEEYIQKIKCRLLDTCMNFFLNTEKQMEQEDILEIQSLLSKNWDAEDLGYTTATLGMRCWYLDKQYQRSNLLVKDKGWIFPYEDIFKGAQVIIYGAGDMGTDYYNQIIKSGYCKVAAWVDKAYNKFVDNDEITSPDLINSVKYDYIIIAIRNIKAKNEVKKYLLNIGVQESAII